MGYTEKEVLENCKGYFEGDELAAQVALKYLLQDKNKTYVEINPDDMHKRMSKEFRRIERHFEENYGGKALTQDEIFGSLSHFRDIVPQGSPMAGIGNPYQTVSLSNCVVVESPDDDMSGIMETGKQLANLFKRRCGVGCDLSNLRPDGASVNNAAGTSTGAWSFADLYSYICKKIGQNGRRGALMLTMDVRHPDIFQFVKMKSEAHPKIKELTGIEIPHLVTGANVSVRITNEFMQAVKDDQEFMLRFPVDSTEPTHTKWIKAKELWDTIVKHATFSAEPGLMMWDNILEMLPAQCYADVGFKHLTTNPCRRNSSFC